MSHEGQTSDWILNVCPLADGAQAKTELPEQHEAAMVLSMKVPTDLPTTNLHL